MVAYIADVGQEEDFEQVRRNAEMTGADEVVVVDCKEDFVKDYIFPSIAGNAVYEIATFWEHRWLVQSLPSAKSRSRVNTTQAT